MPEIKLLKLSVSHKTSFDQALMLIRIYDIVNATKLTKGDMQILSFFIIYGINNNTTKILLDSRVVTHKQTIYNTKSKLLKLGYLLVGINRQYRVADFLQLGFGNIIGVTLRSSIA